MDQKTLKKVRKIMFYSKNHYTVVSVAPSLLTVRKRSYGVTKSVVTFVKMGNQLKCLNIYDPSSFDEVKELLISKGNFRVS